MVNGKWLETLKVKKFKTYKKFKKMYKLDPTGTFKRKL